MLNNIVFLVLFDVVLAIFSVFLSMMYFDIFLQRKRKKYAQKFVIVIFFVWQLITLRENTFSVYVNISVTVTVTLLIVIFTYEGKIWGKHVFVILFNAIWMFMEIICDYILINYFDNYLSLRLLKTVSSKMLFLFIILALKIIFIDYIRLKKSNSVYEQQLELCERHQREIELSILQIRDIKHNMKNNLNAILAYIENRDYERATQFINEIMESSGMGLMKISNTGNVVIDSLINYWSTVAEKYGINFITEFYIPMQIPFKGVDLCLILGNALENAVEATRCSEYMKYIQIGIRYDKENLLLSVKNSFDGYVKRNKYGKLKSAKIDVENHGIGLETIHRITERYQGTVIVDVVENDFTLKVLLYCQKEK